MSVALGDLGADPGEDLDERARGRCRRPVDVPGDRDQSGRDVRHLEHGDVRALRDTEQRHDGMADTRTDETLQDPALVRAEDDLRLEAARAQVRLCALGRPPVADQGQAAELSGADRPRGLRELGVGGGEEHVGVGEDMSLFEHGVVVGEHEREVEVAALQQRQHLLVVVGLDQLHLHPRPPFDVAPHGLGEQADARALERADAKGSGLALGQRAQVGLGGAHRRRRAARVPEQASARVGRRHRAPATRALEQLQAGRALERRDLLADRRLRVAERDSGAAERPRLDDGLERSEVADLDPCQPMMVCDHNIQIFAFYESVGYDDAEVVKRFDLELRVLLVFAFANGIAESAIVPLLPAVRTGLGLSTVEAGMLLSTATLAMLVATMPIGLATNRLGTRRLMLLAGLLIPAGLVGQALAGGLGVLLAARVVSGLAFGILWVVGPARASARGRGAGGTGPLLAASGAGWLVGPILSGGLAQVVGWRAALAALAVTTLPLFFVVLRYAVDENAGETLDRRLLRATIGTVRRSRTLVGATLASGLLGVVTGASGLLVPLALAANGVSSGGIGLVFGISGVVWIASATVVGRLDASVVHLRAVGLLAAILACAWIIPAVHLSTVAIVAFLILSAGCRPTIAALAYAVVARESGRASVPAVIGVMNLAWAVMALVTPLLAGLAVGSAEVRVAFAAIGALALVVALVVLVPRTRRATIPAT